MMLEGLTEITKSSYTGDDLISRQDAIDAFDDNLWVTGRENANEVSCYIRETIDKIKALPSADATEMMEDGTLAVRVSGAKDVSRVLVMDTDSHVGGGLYYVDKDDEPTGEWIKSNILPNGWHCSNCDVPVMTDDIEEMLFCPNCGCPMKGGAE